jgi:PPE-repeat protein
MFESIENFGFRSSVYYDINDELLESQLLELITRYCTKIKFFESIGFNDQNINLAFNLIDNIKQNLNYLTIDLNYDFGLCFTNDRADLSSIVLQNLGQILPFKLEYLNLTLFMSTNDFEIFLNNSQNTFIKKSLLSNVINGTREKVGKPI